MLSIIVSFSNVSLTSFIQVGRSIKPKNLKCEVSGFFQTESN